MTSLIRPIMPIVAPSLGVVIIKATAYQTGRTAFELIDNVGTKEKITTLTPPTPLLFATAAEPVAEWEPIAP